MANRRQEHFDADRLWRYLEVEERSMNWLAQKTGFSSSYLTKMRTGQKPVTERFARSAAEVLKVSVELLFAPSDSPFSDPSVSFGVAEQAVA